MARLIDADAFKTRLEHEAWSRGPIELLRARDIADETPTVDAVPVIRCKDCIWNREKEWVDCYMSGMHGRNVNNFCSQGKRREE